MSKVPESSYQEAKERNEVEEQELTQLSVLMPNVLTANLTQDAENTKAWE